MKIVSKGIKWFKAKMYESNSSFLYKVEINDVSKDWVVECRVRFFAKTEAVKNKFGSKVTLYPTMDEDIIFEEVSEKIDRQFEIIDIYALEHKQWYKHGKYKILKELEGVGRFESMREYIAKIREELENVERRCKGMSLVD